MTAVVFGKMPTHGDFVSLGWTPDEAGRWDDWLAREILDQRGVLGEAFEDRFDQAPVWRFSVPRDSVGLAGAMAPSQDSVGRRFMLIAARASEAAGPALAEACENLIYDALTDGWTAPQLRAAIEAEDDAAGGDAAPAEWWTVGNDRFPEAYRSGERPEGLVALMLTPRPETV